MTLVSDVAAASPVFNLSKVGRLYVRYGRGTYFGVAITVLGAKLKKKCPYVEFTNYSI